MNVMNARRLHTIGRFLDMLRSSVWRMGLAVLALRAMVGLALAKEAAPLGGVIGDGITRWDASLEARMNAAPSLSMTEARAPGAEPEAPAVKPRFYRVSGRPAVFLDVPEGTDLYGTGEVYGPLRRNGTRTVAWNHDAYGYGAVTPHLYQSHPWVLAVRPDGTAFGVLADTSWRTLIDLKSGILFVANGPEFPVIVIDRESPQAVLRGLAELCGAMDLPPLWALGYHQCRYSYTPDDRVREIAREFRSRDIPCDVVWLDIDYMDGYRSFTFDPVDFPRPDRLDAELQEQGFHTIAIIDPGIRRERGYAVYDSGEAVDAWVRRYDGGVYTGKVWPGECVFPDFTSARVRSWWAGLYADFLSVGIDGVWNDMNEPAVFDVGSKTMPTDNVHRADPELGGQGPHAKYHNVYGMLMARATREGMLAARPDRRPFVLTRANHLGGHRYAATWTGDNVASWPHLDASLSMVLNLGLSGQPFSGPDIGGFVGAGDGAMFARWMGFGALLPFARGHTGKGNIDKEPWAFGPEVEATCRRALQGRMRLMPYLYTLFREASVTGLPVWRPLFFADPADPRLRDVDDAVLIGDAVLLAARTSPDAAGDAPLPRGRWREITAFVFGTADDPDLPRLYLREGAALPLAEAVAHTGLLGDPTVLLVNPDAGGRAVGRLYRDAGEGFGYRDGEFWQGRFEVGGGGGEPAVTAVTEAGGWAAPGAPAAVMIVD
jgi:alpha-glucosidase